MGLLSIFRILPIPVFSFIVHSNPCVPLLAWGMGAGLFTSAFILSFQIYCFERCPYTLYLFSIHGFGGEQHNIEQD